MVLYKGLYNDDVQRRILLVPIYDPFIKYILHKAASLRVKEKSIYTRRQKRAIQSNYKSSIPLPLHVEGEPSYN